MLIPSVLEKLVFKAYPREVFLADKAIKRQAAEITAPAEGF